MRFDRLENSTGTVGLNVTDMPARSEVGLAPIVPTSVSVPSGSGSYSTTTGLITFSNVTDVRIDGVFSSTYSNYRVLISSTGASVNMTLNIRMRASGTEYTTANHAYAVSYWGYPGAVSNTGSTTGTYCQVGWIEGAVSARNATSIDVFNPANPLHTAYSSNSISYVASNCMGHIPTTTIYDGITISSGSTPTFSGTVKIYGYR
jgi:hypothetical protein